jgi:hypothetical protein
MRSRMEIFFCLLYFFEITVPRFIAAVDSRVVIVAFVIIIIIIITYLVFTKFLTFEDWTDRFSRNVGKELLLIVA